MDFRTERHTKLAHLRRMRFGAPANPHSESLGTQTCGLLQETLAADVAAAEADSTSTQPG
ncbi:MAG: hypothetical protein KBD39_01875 [Sterolibacterium sp.]|jgi:hypothetical protein|nr:hypothetical protein [Sterolibacterium sp.]MBP9798853.1 hypothetical protein [Sterolibacterium sp.]